MHNYNISLIPNVALWDMSSNIIFRGNLANTCKVFNWAQLYKMRFGVRIYPFWNPDLREKPPWLFLAL